MFLSFLLMSLTVQENVAIKDLSQMNIENYTSCEKFLENTNFDPETVIDTDWKIFYFWNPNFEESYIMKFSYATQVLIDRFRVELDSEMVPPVNWTESLLFMETTIDFSALVVKTNVSGIFRLVPSLAFEYNHIPLITVAMKVVHPGYLGLMNCKYRFCYALAPNDKMPNHDYLTEEAQRLGFFSDFGRTHTATIPPIPNMPTERYEEDDDDEDENLEIIHQQQNLQFL